MVEAMDTIEWPRFDICISATTKYGVLGSCLDRIDANELCDQLKSWIRFNSTDILLLPHQSPVLSPALAA